MIFVEYLFKDISIRFALTHAVRVISFVKIVVKQSLVPGVREHDLVDVLNVDGIRVAEKKDLIRFHQFDEQIEFHRRYSAEHGIPTAVDVGIAAGDGIGLAYEVPEACVIHGTFLVIKEARCRIVKVMHFLFGHTGKLGEGSERMVNGQVKDHTAEVEDQVFYSRVQHVVYFGSR